MFQLFLVLSVLASVVNSVLTSEARAGTLIGVKMPDEISEEGHKLLLNGMGVRKKDIVLGISVNVYVAGLYVEKKSQDAGEIINSRTFKKVHLLFTHSVGLASLRDAWSDGFLRNCPAKNPECVKQEAPLKSLLALMKDVDENDEMDFVFDSEQIRIFVKKKLSGSVPLVGPVGQEFKKTILKCWLGDPPNPELKSGMLGLPVSS